MTPPRTTGKGTYDPENWDQIRVHDIEARGKRYEVKVTKDGVFTAEVQGKTVWGDTREELRDKIMKATKRARVTVEIPFSILTRQGRYGSRPPIVRNGIAVGLHQGHGAVLVKYDDGKAEQLDHKFGSDTTLVPLSEDEAKQWVRLVVERDAAYKALRDFEDAHHIDIRKVVEEAVEEKVGDGS